MFQRILPQIVLPVLIVAIGVGGLIWLSAKDAPPERIATQTTPPLVETIAMPAGVSSFQIRVGGNVVPRREVTLSAEVAGAVIFKAENIESGRYVGQGTPLLRIDPARFELQFSELGSEIQQIASDLRKLEIEEQGTKSLLQLAEREAEIATAAQKRLKALALKNVVTDAETEAVERTELQAGNKLRVLANQRDLIPSRRERLQAQMKLIELQQQQAQLNLDRTRIVAPFAGMITTFMVEQGDYVETGDVLLKLDDTSAIDVECSLQMDDLYWLWNSNVTRTENALPETNDATKGDAGKNFEVPEADAAVTCEVAGRLFHWNGKLARYEGLGVNRKTRTVSCRVRVVEPVRIGADDGPPTLMRGMYVTVTLNVNPRIRLWRLPTRAVQPNGQVWTVNEGILRRHKVQPVKVLPDGVLVRTDSTDLMPGDHIVTTQLVTPLDGSRIREIVTDWNVVDATDVDGGDSP